MILLLVNAITFLACYCPKHLSLTTFGMITTSCITSNNKKSPSSSENHFWCWSTLRRLTTTFVNDTYWKNQHQRSKTFYNNFQVAVISWRNITATRRLKQKKVSFRPSLTVVIYKEFTTPSTTVIKIGTTERKTSSSSRTYNVWSHYHVGNSSGLKMQRRDNLTVPATMPTLRVLIVKHLAILLIIFLDYISHGFTCLTNNLFTKWLLPSLVNHNHIWCLSTHCNHVASKW